MDYHMLGMIVCITISVIVLVVIICLIVYGLKLLKNPIKIYEYTTQIDGNNDLVEPTVKTYDIDPPEHINTSLDFDDEEPAYSMEETQLIEPPMEEIEETELIEPPIEETQLIEPPIEEIEAI